MKQVVCGQVSVDVPDQKGRLEILKVHARNKKLGEDVDLSEVASRVPGFTGADLANLLNEVSISPFCGHCTRNCVQLVSLKHLPSKQLSQVCLIFLHGDCSALASSLAAHDLA